LTRVFKSKLERKIYFRKVFEELLQQNRFLIVINSAGLRAKLLVKLRRLADEYGYILKGGKNGVLLKAIENIYPNDVDKIKPHLQGQNIFIFTNNDPVDLAIKLSQIEISLPASPGDIAPDDIVIPAGNTGIPPGPIIGLFSSLNIPTKIISGTIHITRDVLIAKKGDKISLDIANILSKLGIEPIIAKVKFRFAYDFMDKIVLMDKDLVPDLEQIKSSISECASKAFYLSIGIKYPAKQTIPVLLLNATTIARNIAFKLRYVTDRNIPEMLHLAVKIAEKLNEHVSS